MPVRGKKKILIHFPDNNGLLVQKKLASGVILIALYYFVWGNGRMLVPNYSCSTIFQSEMGGCSGSFFQDCTDIETIPCFSLLLSTWKHLFIHLFLLDCIMVAVHMVTRPWISSTVYIYSTHTYFFQHVSRKVRCNSSNVIKTVQKLFWKQVI